MFVPFSPILIPKSTNFVKPLPTQLCIIRKIYIPIFLILSVAVWSRRWYHFYLFFALFIPKSKNFEKSLLSPFLCVKRNAHTKLRDTVFSRLDFSVVQFFVPVCCLVLCDTKVKKNYKKMWIWIKNANSYFYKIRYKSLVLKSSGVTTYMKHLWNMCEQISLQK